MYLIIRVLSRNYMTADLTNLKSVEENKTVFEMGNSMADCCDKISSILLFILTVL